MLKNCFYALDKYARESFLDKPFQPSLIFSSQPEEQTL